MRLSSLFVLPLLLAAVSCGGGNKMRIVHTGLTNDGPTLARLRAGGTRMSCQVNQTEYGLTLDCAPRGKVTFIADQGQLVAGCDGNLRNDCGGFVAQVLDAAGGAGYVATGGPPPGPDPSLRPAGNGWHCFTMVKTDLHACERSYTSCDGVRARLLPKYPDILECAPQATAFCHSFVSDTGNMVLSCWGNQSNCIDSTKGAKGASGCTMWD
jgi:hypothetical protein